MLHIIRIENTTAANVIVKYNIEPKPRVSVILWIDISVGIGEIMEILELS